MVTWVLIVLTAALALGYNIVSTRSNVDSAVLLNYWLFATLLVASLVLTRLVSFFLVKVLFPRLTGKVSTQLLRLSVEFVTFGTLFILNANLVLGANLSTLLTTSAVITIVLGFALQATLGNVFEGLSMQIHQPFGIGDGLEFGDYYGTVESLTWRAIALRQNDNTLLIVPNNVLAQSAVVVYAEDQPYQATCTFFAPVDVPPNQIRELLEPALARLHIVHPMRLPEVFMEDYTPSGSAIRYQAKLFVPYEYRLDYCRSMMMERIWYSLARAGISIPTAVESTISNYKIPLIYSRDSLSNTTESVMRILRQCQIFNGISEASLERLATQGKRQI